jgi:hypothetical protein
MRTASRPSMSGRPHDHQVDLHGLSRLHGLGAVFCHNGFELLIQRELIGQRITQFGVVINDQDFARVGHSLEKPP